KIEHISGGIALTDEIRTDLQIVMKDADAAKELAQKLKDGLEMVKTMIATAAAGQPELSPAGELAEKLKVSVKDSTVVVTGRVTREFLEELTRKQQQEKKKDKEPKD